MITNYLKFSLQKSFLLLLSALFYIQTYPANDYPLLVWVSLIAWFLALDKNSWKQNLFFSFLFAGIIFLVYLWIPYSDAVFTIFNEVLLGNTLIFIHLFSYMIPFIILGSVYHKFNSYHIRDSIYLASLFTVLSLGVPTVFTYNMAMALYDYPILLQVLDISGVSLLLWFIVLVNLSFKNIIFLLLEKNIKKDFLQNSILIVLSLFFILGYGYWHLNTKKEIKEELTIATIQPNMEASLHQMSMIRDNKKITPHSHIELSRKALTLSQKIDLIIWPEGGLLVDCDNKAISKKLSTFTQEVATPLMYQCNQCVGEGNLSICYNQSRYIGTSGKVEAIYNKQKLIPIFEHIPEVFKKTFVANQFHNELLFEKGDNSKLFHNNNCNIIPTICYDAHSNELIRKGLELQGNLLVIQSNDGVFKTSNIGLFDTATNIISAVSFRVAMVKSSNSGYGVFLSSSGEIIDDSLTPPNQKYVSVNRLALGETYSFYREYGDWFYWFSLLVFLYISMERWRKNS